MAVIMEPTNDEKVDYTVAPVESQNLTSVDPEQLKTILEASLQRRKMARRAQHRLFTILLLSLFAIGALCGPANNVLRRNAASKAVPVPEPEQLTKFQELLNSIEPSSLHNILHKHLKEKYQHGVYQEDKQAMEVIYSHDADAATSLVELAKRQANGSSTAPTVQQSPPPTTQLPSTSQPPATTANEPPTSSPPPSTTPPTSQSPTQQQSSTSTKATSTPATPSTSGSSSSTPTTEKSSSTKSTNQSTPPGTSSNNQQTSSSTDGRSSKSETTPTPSRSPSSVTQQIVYKTTLADGAQTTVTSITVVPAQADGTGGTASKTSRGAAGLQTGAATREGSGFNAALLGALGMAAAVAM